MNSFYILTTMDCPGFQVLKNVVLYIYLRTENFFENRYNNDSKEYKCQKETNKHYLVRLYFTLDNIFSKKRTLEV